MAIKFSNNFGTTLGSSISSGATSFTVASASGFPSLSGGDYVYVTIDSEVVKVTATSGTTFTCDATSSGHSAGDTVEIRVTAEMLEDFATDAESLPVSGGQMTGNITMSGSETVDGRDLSVDGSKLDGIAASANNYTHPNHSGEVTSTADGAQVIADNVVDEANLKVDNTPTNDYVLTAKSSASGGLTWAATAESLPTQSSNSGKFLTTNGSAASWAVVPANNTTTYGLFEMSNTISANYTITSGNNAITASPITIDTGVSLTIPSGSTFVIA